MRVRVFPRPCSPRMEAIVAAGGMEAIVAALATHVASEQMVPDGCFAIANLVSCDLAHVVRMCAAGCPAAVVAALAAHPESATVACAACNAVCALASGDPAGRIAIAAAGG